MVRHNFFSGLREEQVQEMQTGGDGLRGIGWMTVMTVRKVVNQQLDANPQAGRVSATIIDGKEEVIPEWELFSSETGWKFFPEPRETTEAQQFHEWKNGNRREEVGGYIPLIGTPEARASLQEMVTELESGGLEKATRDLLGLEPKEDLTLEHASKITDWTVSLPLALAKEPTNKLQAVLLKIRRQIPSRTLRLTFEEPSLAHPVTTRNITLNNLSKGALIK